MSYDLVATSDYIRAHEVFLVRVDLSDYLVDYYHHRKDILSVVKPEQDEKLKDAISCFAIHLSARTALETHAWTLHIVADEPYSLFVTGSTGEIKSEDEQAIARGFLVGHVLTEHIRHADVHGFHAQCTYRGNTTRSFVPCETADIGKMVQTFYSQSEQRPIRVKISTNSDTALGLVALPGYDPEWFHTVDLDELAAREDLDTSRMRNCRFSFACECSPQKLMPFFQALSPDALDELYGEDEELHISCPRCGKQFAVARSDIWVGEH